MLVQVHLLEGLSAPFLRFMLLFNDHDFFQFLIYDNVSIIASITDVSCFRTEQEHEDELEDQEDLEHVEKPEPAKALENLPANDRRQAGRRVKHEIDDSNAETSFMHEIDVADGCNNERLEGRCGEPLNDTRR